MNQLETLQKSDFVLSNLDHCQRFLDNINKQVNFILLSLKTSNAEELYDLFATLSESLDLFFELSSKLVSIMKKKILNSVDKSLILEVKQLNIQHLSIIRSLMYCFKTKDFIGFADLLEYELKDGLTQWKINFIPRLKAQLN